MAECEVCGCQIRGKPILVSISGTKMSVCPKCAKLGTPLEMPGSEIKAQQGKIHSVPRGTMTVSVSSQKKRPARDVFDMMDGDIAEDFSERIRAARTAKGLSQKELALELKEKEGLIRKIESGLIPEDAVRQKLEKFLEISLIDSADSLEKASGKGSMAPTLGDVMKIKRK